MKGRNIAVMLAAVCALSVGSLAQQAQPGAWQNAKRQDPLHGTSFDTFTLPGEYLNPPQAAPQRQPRLVVLCSRGKFKQALLDTGIVIEPARNATNGGLAHSLKGAVHAVVEVREDDKKPGRDSWEITNDQRALSLAVRAASAQHCRTTSLENA